MCPYISVRDRDEQFHLIARSEHLRVLAFGTMTRITLLLFHGHIVSI